MNEKMKTLLKEYEVKKLVALSEIQFLLAQDMLDEDGYPTESALKIVRTWPCGHNIKEYFEFIKSIWWAANWGWTESSVPNDYNPAKNVHQYSISTGGWSGNESIIREMQNNTMLWHLNWVQSRRGGHYIFELRSDDD